MSNLNKIYFDLGKEGAYTGSAKALKNAFKRKYPQSNISQKMAQDFLDKQEAYSLHRNARTNFSRNIIYVPGPNIQFCCDLIDLNPFKKQNSSFRYILLVLDCFTKYAFAEPLKTKGKLETLAAFKKIIKSAPALPKLLQTDMGTEFINDKMKAYLKSKKIKLFVSDGVKKNSICERAIKTIKDKLFRYFDKNFTRNWVDILDGIIATYNASYHRSIGRSPDSVNFHNSEKVFLKLYGKKISRQRPKLSVGDVVRIRRLLRFVDKAYENRWSRAVYIISRGPKYPKFGSLPMYEIKHVDTGKKIPGSYYEHDLLRVDRKIFLDDFIFPIEKKIKYRVKNKVREVYVKWLGYDTHGWVPVKSLGKIKQYK